jgi:SAM-dependent methyltransferase
MEISVEKNWTGERIVPGVESLQGLFQTHLARYAFAKHFFLKVQRVLDLGCGTGYGSYYLAERLQGADVLGMDVASEAVQFAHSEYRHPKLHYLVGDASHTAISSHSFDGIVCFEVIEHIPNPEELLMEANRLLRNDGICVISTPNRHIYSPGSDRPWNPYHVKEFTLDEFQHLLAAHFPHIKVWGQQHTVGTLFFPPQSYGEVQAREALLGDLNLDQAFYFIAICSHSPLPDLGPVQYWPLEAKPWRDQLIRKQRHLEELSIRCERCSDELHRTSTALKDVSEYAKELESLWLAKLFLAVRKRLLGNR